MSRLFTRITPFLLALSFGFLAACSTIESRIKADAAYFQGLEPEQREKIKQGGIGVGYTERMVKIALGAPDEITEKLSDKGTESTWIYLSVRHDFAGRAVAGYRRVAVRDPKTGAVLIFAEPVYTDLYRAEAEEYLRVIFRDGKVSAIEQEKQRRLR